MTSFLVYLDAAAVRRLEAIAAETGRTVENLIATAAEEQALDHYRHRSDDPGRLTQPQVGERS